MATLKLVRKQQEKKPTREALQRSARQEALAWVRAFQEATDGLSPLELQNLIREFIETRTPLNKKPTH